MTTTLSILEGNGHNEQSLVTWVRGADFDAGGLAEADRLIGDLKKIPGLRVHVTDETFDRAKDTPILVRARFENHGFDSAKVSRALGKPGSDLNRVAPARVMSVAYFHHEIADLLGAEGVCLINIHPDAGPNQLTGKNPRAPIVREYRKVWRAARKAWRTARREGYLVIIVGDMQLAARTRRPWSPWTQAKRMRAGWHNVGIDWILFDRRLHLDRVRLHPLFDHVGFIADLIPKRRR